MSKAYVSDHWSEAPEGYRFALSEVNESAWMPLSDAAAAVGGFEAPGGSVLKFLAWRIAHGTISAKAGEFLVFYGDSDEHLLIRNLPITSEWGTELWSNELSEHWTTNAIRTVTQHSLGRITCDYRLVSLDRDGVLRLLSHLAAINESDRPALPPVPDPAKPAKRRGRPPGAGSFLPLDKPLLEEMQLMLDDGRALSAHAAATALASRAHGGGTLESKATRLRDSFLKTKGNAA